MASIEAIRHEIETSFGATGLIEEIGFGGGGVRVRLRPDASQLATCLTDQYGDAIEITVGVKRFPAGASCAPQVAAPVVVPFLHPGLRTVVRAVSPSVRQGELGRGVVGIECTSMRRSVAIAAGPGWLCLNDPPVVVGGYSGFIAAALRVFELYPGTSVEVPFVFGTASYVDGPDYVVPPGSYQLFASLAIRPHNSNGAGKVRRGAVRGPAVSVEAEI